MNGADVLIETLVQGGVDVCFVNPGTSEMHLVQAIDGNPKMRSILCLFEGVCSGAADGYARMKGTPASTVFHLGPGFANSIACQHDARRAKSPIVNIIGNHATWHIPYDAPLNSDIHALASAVSSWIHMPAVPDQVGQGAADAIAASLSPSKDSEGNVATLILPADCSWGDTIAVGKVPAIPERGSVDQKLIEDAAERLMEDSPGLLYISGAGLTEDGIKAAHRIAAKTGARLMTDMFPARMERGAGTLPMETLPYFPEDAVKSLTGIKHFIMVGVTAPVSFFAYKDVPPSLIPEDTTPFRLAEIEEDAEGALLDLADAMDAPDDVDTYRELSLPDGKPSGDLTAMTIGQSVAQLMPEGAIVANDSNTSGGPTSFLTASAAPHSWLSQGGGAIGLGFPMATGAAVACPDRKVINLEGDGSGMYVIQSLWTQARENLDVTNIIFSNRKYQILAIEYARAGVQNPGPKALDMFDLGKPDLDFSQIGQGMGVDSVTVTTAEDFHNALDDALSNDGPNLIEAVI